MGGGAQARRRVSLIEGGTPGLLTRGRAVYPPDHGMDGVAQAILMVDRSCRYRDDAVRAQVTRVRFEANVSRCQSGGGSRRAGARGRARTGARASVSRWLARATGDRGSLATSPRLPRVLFAGSAISIRNARPRSPRPSARGTPLRWVRCSATPWWTPWSWRHRPAPTLRSWRRAGGRDATSWPRNLSREPSMTPAHSPTWLVGAARC